MGSRLRENPSRFIECWCEIVAPQDADHPPWIIQKFPSTYEETEVLKSIPQFTFPCPFEKSAVQHFSFVLTNLESKFLYGFCRHAPDTQTAIVILSHLPWHELFYKILNHCSTLISNKNSGDLWSYLQCLYQTSVPSPGSKFTLNYGDDKYFVAECPNHISLPSIPENRNLSEYYSAVDAKNMMLVFASMLNERRIIVTSDRVSRLSACVQAANSLIYPMSWQHIFIPVLPEHLLDYLNAPMPFLIGVASSLIKKVRLEELGDVVILDADNGHLTSPFQDIQCLPEEVVSTLRKNLSSASNQVGDGVARAFLKALVQLIGNYREALQFRESDKRITFNQDKFVTQRPPHFQPFVLKMLELQIFSQFIEERLDLLNSGLHTSDEFELEASVYGERSSSKVKQIFRNVRKESGAIMSNVKSKTNPAMKSAVKSVSKSGKNVREKSLNTYKELRGKFKDIQHKNSETPQYVNGVKPRSAPSSPTHSTKRPQKSISGVYEGYSARATYKRSSQHASNLNSTSTGSLTSVTVKKQKSVNHFESETQKTPSPQEIDLLGEMRDVLSSQLGFSTTSSSIQETTSISSINSSILSSDAGGNFFCSDNTKDLFSEALITNGSERPLPPEGSKPLNASFTSLPLLDLSLDITLPPPLFPPPPPAPMKHDPHPPFVDGGMPSTRSRHSSYRSPKILPPETFGSLPSSLEDTMVVNSSSLTFGGGSSSGLYSRPKAYTLPVEGERQVGGVRPPIIVPRKYHNTNFPKYDVNPSFSASLAKFSSKENFSSYYYSSLCNTCSKSSNSVLDFDATEPSLVKPFAYNNKPNNKEDQVTPISPPDILKDSTSWDIMTMSLPLDITSISDIPTPASSHHPTPPASSKHPSSSYSASHTTTTSTRAADPSHATLLSPPPRYRRRRKKATSPAQEGDTSQDILLLDSPKDEEFDPLLTKGIPPPLPTRQIFKADFIQGLRDNAELKPRNSSLVIDPPGKLKPDRFLPFSSLQSGGVSNRAVQNPLYNPHQPPFNNRNVSGHPNNNPAAVFAASLISSETDGGSFHNKTSGINPFGSENPSKDNSVFGSDPFGSDPFGSDPFGSDSFVKPREELGKEQDLLGDFSADFKKLSVVSRNGGVSTS